MSCLLKAVEAPKYMQEFAITTGYRKSLSYRECLFSWFRLHNETVNIWSHLIGFLIFVYNLANIIWWPPVDAKHLQLLPLIIQLLSYQVCMLSSTLFHTFSCHSEKAHDSWQETDHLGILTALFGTYISLLSVIFTCFPHLQILHTSVVVVIFTVVVAARYWPGHKCFGHSSKSPKIPLSIFLAVSLYSVIPLSHWAWLHGGFDNDFVQEKLYQIFLPFVIGGVGLAFYITRFPESKFREGSVDILGSSHQVWHVMIFLGMAFWYKETSSSFIKFQSGGFNCVIGDNGHNISNATDILASSIVPDEMTMASTLTASVQQIFNNLVNAIYLEELAHCWLGDIFNIF